MLIWAVFCCCFFLQFSSDLSAWWEKPLYTCVKYVNDVGPKFHSPTSRAVSRGRLWCCDIRSDFLIYVFLCVSVCVCFTLSPCKATKRRDKTFWGREGLLFIPLLLRATWRLEREISVWLRRERLQLFVFIYNCDRWVSWKATRHFRLTLSRFCASREHSFGFARQRSVMQNCTENLFTLSGLASMRWFCSADWAVAEAQSLSWWWPDRGGAPPAPSNHGTGKARCRDRGADSSDCRPRSHSVDALVWVLCVCVCACLSLLPSWQNLSAQKCRIPCLVLHFSRSSNSLVFN